MFGKIPFEQLSVFSGNLARCLAAGIDVANGLETSGPAIADPDVRLALREAARLTGTGRQLSEALVPLERWLPPFFIPVIRCGEESGRLDDAMRYLEHHCRLLIRPTRAMRNTWLLPLTIIIFGSLTRTALGFLMLPFGQALGYALRTATNYAIGGAVVGLVVFVPGLMQVFNTILLALPVVGQAVRDLALNRFFHAFNMLYSTGGLPVERMIQLAAVTVSNTLIQSDLLSMVTAIKSGSSISHAFSVPKSIGREQQAMIEVGEEAGKLDEALATLARLSGESVEHRLAMFNQFFVRVVVLVVVFSLAMTILSFVSVLKAR